MVLGQFLDGHALTIKAPAYITEVMHARVMPNPRPKVKAKRRGWRLFLVFLEADAEHLGAASVIFIPVDLTFDIKID